jgi:hypothetical protein
MCRTCIALDSETHDQLEAGKSLTGRPTSHSNNYSALVRDDSGQEDCGGWNTLWVLGLNMKDLERLEQISALIQLKLHLM